MSIKLDVSDEVCPICNEIHVAGNLNSTCIKTYIKARDLLAKHGICIDCGEMYSHDIDEPFASCRCKTSEWYSFTPYMELEKKVRDQKELLSVIFNSLKLPEDVEQPMEQNKNISFNNGVRACIDSLKIDTENSKRDILHSIATSDPETYMQYVTFNMIRAYTI